MLLAKVGAPALHSAMESASGAAMENLAAVAEESVLRKLLPGASITITRRLLDAASNDVQRQRVLSAMPKESIDALYKTEEVSPKSSTQQPDIQNPENVRDRMMEYRRREEVLQRARDEIDRRVREVERREREVEDASRNRVQAKIEEKVPQYVSEALKALADRETLYKQKKAECWSWQGSIILAAAVIAVASLSLYGYTFGEPITSFTWPSLLFLTFKGLIILGVLGLWAKHTRIYRQHCLYARGYKEGRSNTRDQFRETLPRNLRKCCSSIRTACGIRELEHRWR